MRLRRPPLPRLRLLQAAILLLCVLLPALVAGVQIDAPPTAGEVHRLERAQERSDRHGPAGVAEQFLRAALPAGAPQLPATRDALAAVVARARLLQVMFLLAASGLLYLAVALARGRLVAVAACVGFAVLPPVADQGAILRVETVAMVFGWLAVVLWQCLARIAWTWRGRLRWRDHLHAAGLIACAATSAGLAIGALPDHGAVVLAPGLVLVVAGAWLAWRSVRLLRLRGIWRLPIHALNRRLLPWTVGSFAGLGLALLVLQSTPAADLASGAFRATSASGLWPAGVAGVLAMGVAGLGAAAAVLCSVVRLARRGRVDAYLVLLVMAAIVLASTASAAPGLDALRAAPFAAWLLAEGGVALAVLLRGRRRLASR